VALRLRGAVAEGDTAAVLACARALAACRPGATRVAALTAATVPALVALLHSAGQTQPPLERTEGAVAQVRVEAGKERRCGVEEAAEAVRVLAELAPNVRVAVANAGGCERLAEVIDGAPGDETLHPRAAE
jgi:hypothetical protein